MAQERPAVLYDGLCRFCTAGARKLAALARADALQLVDFQQPGALDRFPGLTHEECMRQMYLVTPEGRRYGGFEAAVQALRTRPLLGRLALVYYIPGFRWLCNRLYAWVAAHRYRIMGKSSPDGCEGGTCSLHLRPPKP